MKLLKKVKQKLYRTLLSIDKKGFFYALQSIYFDNMVRRLNDASFFNFSQFEPSNSPVKFEDLSGLFFCSPLTRGILRQDIDEAALLFKIVSSMENPVGIEIGRFYGGSTVLLATAVGINGRLISMDIAPKFEDKDLIDVLTRFSFNDRVNLIIGDANSVNVEQSLDFAFIDGDHSYEGARLDHNRWGKKIKVGGYIIHHDMANSRKYSVQWDDLSVLYKDILIEQDSCLKVVAEAGSMVVFKKINENWVDLAFKTEKNITNTQGIQSVVNSYLDREVD